MELKVSGVIDIRAELMRLNRTDGIYKEHISGNYYVIGV